MLQQSLKDVATHPVRLHEFSKIIRSIWESTGKKPRMGIALSGGSDSMALAFLCHEYQKRHLQPRTSFTAFIVDHGARPESHVEAHKVRNMVLAKLGASTTSQFEAGHPHQVEQRIGIDAQVLKLQWTTHLHPSKLPNFESQARILRYQALMKACIEAEISGLLLGHHADDQAETVLSRLKSGYLGPGLQGIARVGDIPECNGIYGCKSGSPRRITVKSSKNSSVLEEQHMLVEDGGVRIYRPLMDFTKAQLQATCRDNGIRWVEDKTNSDHTLTVRNAVRGLIVSDRLPNSLNSKSLIELAEVRRRSEEAERKVVEEIYKACGIRLNMSAGIANVKFPAHIKDLLFRNVEKQDFAKARNRAARLLRLTVMLISSQEQIALKDMEESARHTFSFLFQNDSSPHMGQTSVAPVGKVLFQVSRTSSSESSADTHPIECRIVRAPPTAKDRTEQRITLISETKRRSESFEWTTSKRQLFDGRFWVRLRYRKFNLIPGRRISIRFLQSSDIEALNQDETKYTVWKPLKDLLKTKAPGNARFTLPAIVESHYIPLPSGDRQLIERLVALPTMNWSSAGWQAYDRHAHRESWTWDLRYKQIDFGQSDKHEFVS